MTISADRHQIGITKCSFIFGELPLTLNRSGAQTDYEYLVNGDK